MVRAGLRRFNGGGEGDDGLLASGVVGSRTWQLRRLDGFGPAGSVLVFSAHSSIGSGPGDSCFGMVQLDDTRAILVGTSAAGEHRFAWGLAPRRAAAVWVSDETEATHEATVDGVAVDGRLPFVAVLGAVAIPAMVRAVDRNNGQVAATSLRPTAPTDTGLSSRLHSRALPTSIQRPDRNAIIEGRVDDHEWYFTASRTGDDLALGMSIRAPSGGGSSSGAGPIPTPTRACRIGVTGSGSSGDCWHLHGWADLTIDRISLCTRSGDVVNVPMGGQHLDLGVGLFAIALPNDARGLTLEAFDVDGRLVDRCWLASSLAMTEASIEQSTEIRRRAQSPPPTAVETLWEQVVGEALPAPESDQGSKVIGPLDTDELLRRWPLRPILRPADDAHAWTIVARHFHSERWQSVDLSVSTILGPGAGELDLDRPVIDDGSIIITQGVWWAEPPGHRDPPNTTARGQPARLDVYTRQKNNFEEITLNWDEAAADIDPTLHGLSIAIRAHPLHHTPEQILELANRLQPHIG